MAARPATKLESILGAERAAACEAEIKERIRPDDTPELRRTLVKAILYKHIDKANLPMNDIQKFISSSEFDYCKRMKNDIVCSIWENPGSLEYHVHPNQKSR